MKRAHTKNVGHSGRENEPTLRPALAAIPAWALPEQANKSAAAVIAREVVLLGGAASRNGSHRSAKS